MKYLLLRLVRVMKNKLVFLTKYSLYKKIKTKWFAIVNIILMLAIVSLANIDIIVTYFGGDFNKETVIKVIDKTDVSYDLFEVEMNNYKKQFNNIARYSFKEYDVIYEEKIISELKNSNDILIIIEEEELNYVKFKMISNKFNDQILYQILVATLNNIKRSIAFNLTDIPISELNRIYSPANIEKVALSDDVDRNMDVIMGTIFPTLILPFFMLVIIVVQMVGLEINEEKSTKSMEVIISNVPAQIHFFSKIIASNVFIFIQGILLVLYGFIGFLTRIIAGHEFSLTGNFGIELDEFWKQLVTDGVIDQLIYVIPIVIVLFLLSFVFYSLLAGIFSSITVNIEDYQQIQTPIIILLLVGYYLSILAPVFEGSFLIRIMSYIPFFSALLIPSLLILNQITIFDAIISILLLLCSIYILLKYGIKVYKIGILNYSSEKLWGRFSQAIKNKDNI